MDITGALAKLLATENLTIAHKANARTASFQVETRVLTLPVIKDASQEVMTMMAAHEVGHALETPQGWVDKVIKGTPFDFVNVIEDVRIEKFIQDKFPGLKRDFSKGYTELADRNFFEVQGVDTNKLSLIDRINLHFKLGYRAVVNFTDEEKQWLEAINNCVTFDDVCVVAKQLSDWLDEKAEENEENTEEQQGEGEGEGEEQESEQDGNSEEGEGEEGQGMSGRKGEEEEGEEQGEDSTATGDQPEPVDEKTSHTQRAMSENMQTLTNNTGWEPHVTSIQNGDLSAITDIKTIRESFTECKSEGHSTREQYAEFLASIKKDVNHMVQRFEMKKSADAYARASINKTGVLNTARLHQYKLTDDIFLRQTVTHDGKSHGMVMFLDWSGSMGDRLVDTVKQVIVLAQFCRKVQISFQVFTFTSANFRSKEDAQDKALCNEVVDLCEVLNSNTKKNVLETDMLNLFSQALMIERHWQHGPFSNMLNLGGTPLDNALTMVPAIIDQFRSNTGAQKVSFVALTDGQSSPLQYYQETGNGCRRTYGYQNINYITYGKETFKVDTPWNIYSTCGIVKILKKVTTDVTFTNIFIGSKGACAEYIRCSGGQFNGPKFNKEGGVTTAGLGWDLISALNYKQFNQTQEDIVVDSGAKKAQIKSAFKKFLKAQSTSKTVLNELVDTFS